MLTKAKKLERLLKKRARLLAELAELDERIRQARLELAERVDLGDVPDIPRMAVNALRAHGVRTLADAVRLGRSRLSQVPHVGTKAVSAIFRAFEAIS